jgi:hypothetical protein
VKGLTVRVEGVESQPFLLPADWRLADIYIPSILENSSSLLTHALSSAIIGRVGRMIDTVAVSFPLPTKEINLKGLSMV